VVHGRRYDDMKQLAPGASQATLLSTLLSAAKKRPFSGTPVTTPAALVVEAARLNQDLGPRNATMILRSANTILESARDAATAKRQLDSALRFLVAAGGLEPAMQALAAAAAVAEVTGTRR